MSERVVVKWTPAAKAMVYLLWEQDFSGTEIAERIVAEHGLAVTKSSVIGVAFRAGMAGRAPRSEKSKAAASAQPAMSREERRARNRDRKAAKAAERRGGTAPRTPRPVQAPRPVAVARTEPAGIAPSLRIPLTAIRDGECRFIAGDPVHGDGTCCGHPVRLGSRWCAEHHALSTVPVRWAVSVWMPEHRRAA